MHVQVLTKPSASLWNWTYWLSVVKGWCCMTSSRLYMLSEAHSPGFSPGTLTFLPWGGTVWCCVFEVWKELGWFLNGFLLTHLWRCSEDEQYSAGFWGGVFSWFLDVIQCCSSEAVLHKKDELSMSCVDAAIQILLLHLMVVGARPLLQALPSCLQLTETRRGFSSCMSCSWRGWMGTEIASLKAMSHYYIKSTTTWVSKDFDQS